MATRQRSINVVDVGAGLDLRRIETFAELSIILQSANALGLFFLFAQHQ
jgi:hypothetical protein